LRVARLRQNEQCTDGKDRYGFHAASHLEVVIMRPVALGTVSRTERRHLGRQCWAENLLAAGLDGLAGGWGMIPALEVALAEA